MLKTRSLKAYILFWITFLALCMSALLTYQSTQYFLEGFDTVQEWQMNKAADLLPEGESAVVTDFGYHVTNDWDNVPEDIKGIFNQPPQRMQELQLHFENWWYFAPPEKSYSLLSAFNKKGEVCYISRTMEKNQKQEHKPPVEGLDPMVVIALWGIGSLIAFIVIIYKVLSNLAQPIQSLYAWAKHLDLHNAQQPLPDFQYQELNQLAGIIHDNLQNVSRTLEREKEFLGFASHELRTPIATLRSSATLLDKINPSPSLKERDARDRILRASLTMKGITETLLWLNRDNKEAIETVMVDVEEMLNQVIGELRYLLSGKAIKISVETISCTKALPEAAFRILVANIIRNAFQHTVSGEVRVIQDCHRVQVINTLPGEHAQKQTGFGLGLKLIRKLVNRFHWELIEEEADSTLSITVLFNQSEEPV